MRKINRARDAACEIARRSFRTGDSRIACQAHGEEPRRGGGSKPPPYVVGQTAAEGRQRVVEGADPYGAKPKITATPCMASRGILVGVIHESPVGGRRRETSPRPTLCRRYKSPRNAVDGVARCVKLREKQKKEHRRVFLFRDMHRRAVRDIRHLASDMRLRRVICRAPRGVRFYNAFP
jgi:hypothetical protein